MQKAFTMIELIFVIVILGVLASIAIPKLKATRDDAKISAIIANARMVVEHAQSFYTSQGNQVWRNSKISEVTDVPLFLDTSCTSRVSETTDTTPGKFYICDKSGIGAINVVTFVTNNEGNLTITSRKGNLIADAVASNIAMIGMASKATSGKTHILGGVTVFRD